MDVLHPWCAGLDVHQKTVVACARRASPGAVTHEVRTFGTTTRALLALAEWLAERRVHPRRDGVHGGILEARVACPGRPVRARPRQCAAPAPHPGSEERRERRHLDRRSLGPRPHPKQLCPPRLDPRAPRSDAHPQTARARDRPEQAAPAEDPGRRQPEAHDGDQRHPGRQWSGDSGGLDRGRTGSRAVGPTSRRGGSRPRGPPSSTRCAGRSPTTTGSC
jgi:hypothetical protein